MIFLESRSDKKIQILQYIFFQIYYEYLGNFFFACFFGGLLDLRACLTPMQDRLFGKVYSGILQDSAGIFRNDQDLKQWGHDMI